ncbi:MAG: hypothetical protein ATN36_05010 [Epulopiscium sp. Nele67-Bin005]|nr:MAG: hypothetical protein ATN36_05010 [Epulopiscium sp. Nele67-Bin005]
MEANAVIRQKIEEVEMLCGMLKAEDKLEVLRESIPDLDTQIIFDTLVSKEFIYNNICGKGEMFEHIKYVLNH